MREGTQGVDLFVKDLTDDSPARELLAMEGAQFVSQWPADTLLVFENAQEPGSRDLWVLDMSDPERPEARSYLSSEAHLSDPLVSPDGGLVAYISNESGTEELYVRSFPDPGEPTIVSHGGGGVPSWSPDGRTLYYGTRIGRWLVAARLLRDPSPRVLSIDTLYGDPGIGQIPMPGYLSPDGKEFIVAAYPGVATSGAETSQPSRLILVQNFAEELKRLVPTH